MQDTTPQTPEKHEKEFAALSYLWIFSLLIYFSPHAKSDYVRHHARQGMMLFWCSIIVYFLPGYLDYLNLLFVFLMVLGMMEAGLGNRYRLPILGDWLDGKFEGQRHFSLMIHWWQKILNFFKKGGISAISRNPISQAFSATAPQAVDLYGDPIERWTASFQEYSTHIQTTFRQEGIKMQSFDKGFEMLYNGNVFLIFGGVNNDIFSIAYKKAASFLPFDEEHGNWAIKHYQLSTLNKKSFEAFIRLLLDYEKSL